MSSLKRNWAILLICPLLLFVASSALAVTPRKPDAKLAGAAPESCLFYLHSFGFQGTDTTSTNSLEQLVSEPSVREFLDKIKGIIDQSIESLPEDGDNAVAKVLVQDLGRNLVDQPFTFYIADVRMGFPAPEINLGLIVDMGDKVELIKKGLLEFETEVKGLAPQEAFSQTTIDGVNVSMLQFHEAGAPTIAWGTTGRFLLAGIGTDEIKSLIANAKSPPPSWLKPALQRIKIPRRWAFTYTNVAKLNELIVTNAPPEVGSSMKAIGIREVGSLTSAMGLDQDGMAIRTLVGVKTDHGIWELFRNEGISPSDLQIVPGDATQCAAIRLDPDNLMKLVLSLAVEIDPEEGPKFQENLNQFSEAVGLDIQKELVAGLGSRWLMYAMPGGVGPIPRIVLTVDVKDPAGIEKGLAILQQMINSQPEAPVKIEPAAIGDYSGFQMKPAGEAAGPQIAWCLTQDRLAVATDLQLLESLLVTPPEPANSIVKNPKIQSIFEAYDKPMMVSFADSKSGMSQIYQTIHMLMGMNPDSLKNMGIDLGASDLPPLEDILKHLEPSVGVIHRADDGVEFSRRSTMPATISGAMSPILVALGLPAVQSAREAARRAQSTNNLRQISLACLNHESATRTYPPAKFGTDGKNGLSWRVAILPYLEQQQLYDQFHMDEPWDSEHNKKLIEKMPEVFKSPLGMAGPGKTNYLAIAADSAAISGEGKGIGIRNVTDGTSNTILCLEADDSRAVIWTKPDDFKVAQDNPLDGLGGLQPMGFLAAFCDGSVRMLSTAIDPNVFFALTTRDGGEVIDHEDL